MRQEMNNLVRKVRLKERKINEEGEGGTAVLALFTKRHPTVSCQYYSWPSQP